MSSYSKLKLNICSIFPPRGKEEREMRGKEGRKGRRETDDL
jgi:hypothetical protein